MCTVEILKTLRLQHKKTFLTTRGLTVCSRAQETWYWYYMLHVFERLGSYRTLQRLVNDEYMLSQSGCTHICDINKWYQRMPCKNTASRFSCWAQNAHERIHTYTGMYIHTYMQSRTVFVHVAYWSQVCWGVFLSHSSISSHFCTQKTHNVSRI